MLEPVPTPPDTHSTPPHEKRHLKRAVLWGACVLIAGMLTAAVYSIRTDISAFFDAAEKFPTPTVYIRHASTTEAVKLSYGIQPLLEQPDFFAHTKQAFIEGKRSFISADLSKMEISVYEDGVEVEKVPIAAKGKIGSWWETPAGLYKIESKEESHYSSIGHVYQPWSMAFEGNFFIHGWPHHDDGTPVSSTYSGGCIRLHDEESKRIYDHAKVGMPVLVFASDHVNDDFHYEIPPPKVASDAFIIADVKSGTVLASKNAEKKYSMGALVYLLTVLTATDHINMNRQLSVDTAHLATATSSRLAGRDLVSAYALLFPLLMEHSREAAHTLVSYSGVSHFNSLIQEKMESLGMHDSVVVDAAESDPGNVSTPNDLFRLARHLYTNRGFVLNITAGKPVAYAYPQTDFANLNNANATTTPGFVGGILSAEVGNTGAALLLLKVQVRGVPREVALIALDSSDIETDLKELRTYVTTIYQLTPRE